MCPSHHHMTRMCTWEGGVKLKLVGRYEPMFEGEYEEVLYLYAYYIPIDTHTRHTHLLLRTESLQV